MKEVVSKAYINTKVASHAKAGENPNKDNVFKYIKESIGKIKEGRYDFYIHYTGHGRVFSDEKNK